MQFGAAVGNRLVLSFWPSTAEIEESALTEAYLAGLWEFSESVASLQSRARDVFRTSSPEVRRALPRITTYTDAYTEQGRPVNRNAAPVTIELLMTLGTSGLTAGLFSLFKLWVDAKNGRKIRIKLGECEIESTQMNPEDFQKLVEFTLHKNNEINEARQSRELQTLLIANGFTVLDADTHARELRAIREAVDASEAKLLGEGIESNHE